MAPIEGHYLFGDFISMLTVVVFNAFCFIRIIISPLLHIVLKLFTFCCTLIITPFTDAICD